MGESRAETHAERSPNAGAAGPKAAGRDETAATEGRMPRRWLAFSARRERRLEQTGSDPDPRFTFANLDSRSANSTEFHRAGKL